MRLHIVAVGQRLPAWAEAACTDYHSRFNAAEQPHIHSFKTPSREAGRSIAQCVAAEEQRIYEVLQKIGKHVHIVLCDERGTRLRSTDLAQTWRDWQALGSAVVIVLGGPDGFSDNFRTQAQQMLRLSDFTLPHALARVLLLEQLYRAWSLCHGHPYHRA